MVEAVDERLGLLHRSERQPEPGGQPQQGLELRHRLAALVLRDRVVAHAGGLLQLFLAHPAGDAQELQSDVQPVGRRHGAESTGCRTRPAK